MKFNAYKQDILLLKCVKGEVVYSAFALIVTITLEHIVNFY